MESLHVTVKAYTSLLAVKCCEVQRSPEDGRGTFPWALPHLRKCTKTPPRPILTSFGHYSYRYTRATVSGHFSYLFVALAFLCAVKNRSGRPSAAREGGKVFTVHYFVWVSLWVIDRQGLCVMKCGSINGPRLTCHRCGHPACVCVCVWLPGEHAAKGSRKIT